MKRILVTDAGRGAGINFCRSIRLAPEKYEIIALESNPYSIMHADADRKFLSPNPEDACYIDFLKEVVDKEKIDFVYPSKTNESLWKISKHRDEIHATTFLPSDDKIKIYENKFFTNELLKNNGIRVADTVLLRSTEDLLSFMNKYHKIWLRATIGCGGKGSISTDSYDFAKAWIDRYHGWGTFTASEVLTTRTVTWSAIWNNGELVVSQIRERKYWEFSYLSPSGVTGITGAQVTRKDSFIDNLAIECIKTIDPHPHGIISVDFCYDNEGIPNPTEIQASRFFTSTYFMAVAGLNLPYILLKTAFKESVEISSKFSPLEEGLMWIKYVDCTPIFTTEKIIEKNKKSFEKFLKSKGWN